jgi:hypothetical protein
MFVGEGDAMSCRNSITCSYKQTGGLKMVQKMRRGKGMHAGRPTERINWMLRVAQEEEDIQEKFPHSIEPFEIFS